MGRLFALAIAAVLVCSLPALAAPGPFGTEATSDGVEDRRGALDGGTAEWLSLSDGPAASGDGHVTIDVGATLEDDANRLETRYEDHRLDTRMEAANSDTERRAIVREEANRLSEAVAQLRERERTAYRNYYEGERTERQLLAELALIHTNAVTLEQSVSTLETHANDVSDVSIDAQLEPMEVETVTMQGPVRERVARMLHGQTDPTRLYVETDGDGIVLAMVANGEFHREAHRIDNRDPDAETEYRSLGQSEDRIAELYPSIFSDARWSYSEVGHSTHRGVGNHPQGTLTVYLDTGTGDVYREHQTLALDRIDTTPIERQTDEGVEVVVSQSVPGGPAKVTLADSETGAPLSGSVALNDRTIGATNDAGEVWFVAPRDSMTIVADVGSTPIEVSVGEDSATARSPADDDDESS